MVEKDLKRLIDAHEERIRKLEEQLAFSQQENDLLRNELANSRADMYRHNPKMMDYDYAR